MKSFIHLVCQMRGLAQPCSTCHQASCITLTPWRRACAWLTPAPMTGKTLTCHSFRVMPLYALVFFPTSHPLTSPPPLQSVFTNFFKSVKPLLLSPPLESNQKWEFLKGIWWFKVLYGTWTDESSRNGILEGECDGLKSRMELGQRRNQEMEFLMGLWCVAVLHVIPEEESSQKHGQKGWFP